jgi:glycosyltransferase involved in cell wall biosynthesis
MKILACHLLNDYSGSPKVLSQLIQGWIKAGVEVQLYKSSNKKGFLSDLEKVHEIDYWYRWHANPFIRLINYFLSQTILFFKIIINAKPNDIIYVNTVLPFGAALAAKIKSCTVIYHLHEVSMKPKVLKWFLFKIVDILADKVIVVSNYLAKEMSHLEKEKHVLYNALDQKFYEEAILYKKESKSFSNVLMICSLKKYKGVFEFVELAKINLNLSFKMVVNATQYEIDHFFKEVSLSQNITIYCSQSNTHTFYQWADIVINLSRNEEWVETFGLTIIEAMAYGLPCIVPTVGGVTEIITDQEDGFQIDGKDLILISEKLQMLLNNRALYVSLCEKALQKASAFEEQNFVQQSLELINSSSFEIRANEIKLS